MSLDSDNNKSSKRLKMLLNPKLYIPILVSIIAYVVIVFAFDKIVRIDSPYHLFRLIIV